MRLSALHHRQHLQETVTPQPNTATPQQQPVQQQPAQPQLDQFSPTQTWTGDQNRPVSSQEMVDANNMIQTLRTNQVQNLTVDQKIDLMLRRTEEATKVAYQALREVSTFDQRLSSVLTQLTKQESPESIFNAEDDPESIFGR
jgi:hypothetical protein